MASAVEYDGGSPLRRLGFYVVRHCPVHRRPTGEATAVLGCTFAHRVWSQVIVVVVYVAWTLAIWGKSGKNVALRGVSFKLLVDLSGGGPGLVSVF